MLIDRRSGPIGMMCIAAILPLLVGACAHTSDPVDRELELLRAKFEALEKVHVPRYAVGSDYGIGRAPTPTVRQTPTRQPVPHRASELGFPVRETHPEVMPAAESTPRLPVVRVGPANTDPFANGVEPAIRIGMKGRLAPPAKKVETSNSLEYARLDEYGNLVDQDGKIIYRAGGRASLGGGVTPHAPSAFDDPHESPARKVARMMKPPVIQNSSRARVNSPIPVAPTTGEMRRLGLSAGEEPPINVRPTPQLKFRPVRLAAAPKVQASKPQIVVRPVAKPVSVNKEVTTITESSRAPGPNRIIKQVNYKGSKERAAQDLYKKARQVFVTGKYKKSKKVFERFLKRYYNHELADNALYWLGETAYAQSDWVKSLSRFQDVIIRYPEGNKLAGSMLKSALCYAQMGDKAYAVKVLTDVETLFPLERVAQIARTHRMALSGGAL
jgi:tol-pal system protein YbgF